VDSRRYRSEAPILVTGVSSLEAPQVVLALMVESLSVGIISRDQRFSAIARNLNHTVSAASSLIVGGAVAMMNRGSIVMPRGPAARILDPVVHPLPGVLLPGPGSPTVFTGGKMQWRGVPAAAAAAIGAAKATSDATIKAAEAVTLAAAGTPGAPAAKAAEEAVKAAAASIMGSMITGLAGGADIHTCATPLPLPPHGPGVVIDGSPTVLINGLQACRQGDTIIEAVGPPDKIALGCPTVIIGDVPNAIDSLVRPALDAIANDPAVMSAINSAWNASNPDSAGAKQENGFWVVRDDATGQLSTVPFPTNGTRDSMVPGAPPNNPGQTTVAFVHTHPNTDAEGYSQQPSDADTNFANANGVPGIIRSHNGMYYFP
jgi:uncharacterized Zn-binding protein involved in type VI secretion